MIFENNKKASLVLANGAVFEGKSFGAEGKVFGEVVFNTSVVGFQEILTDTGYCGQLIVQTFPLVGNYGIMEANVSSAHNAAAGYIVREHCEEPSNFRCEGTLDAYLKKNGTVGIYNIDTRKLTRILRENGTMNGCIVCGDFDKDAVLAEIKAFKAERAVPAVSVKEKQTISAENGKYNVVMIDMGVTNSLKDSLLKLGCDLTLMPYNATADEIMAENPDGIVITNGAGDPAENTETIETVKALLTKNVPIYGINLGHLVLALAAGAKVEKLKYGHRGATQPVRDIETGRVFIASQNHGYAVAADSVSENIGKVSHIITSDNTVQGISYTNAPAFGTQFAPEISGNPHDTGYLFDRFIKMMEDRK